MNISLSTASASGGGGGDGEAATFNVTIFVENFDKLRAEQNSYATHQIIAYMYYINRNLRASHCFNEREEQNAAVL